MRTWKRNLLASTLLFSLALPTAAHAAGLPSHLPAVPSPGESDETVAEEHGHFHNWHKHARIHSFMGMSVHRQMYLTLLAEKYDPSSVEKWKAAFAERKRLIEQIKAQRSQAKKASEQSKQGQASAVEGKENRDEKRKEWQAYREKWKQNHEEFTEAVKEQDAAKIRAVLPKLLEEVTTVNKLLEKKLENAKSGQK